MLENAMDIRCIETSPGHQAMLILSAADVIDLLPPSVLVAAAETAACAGESGNVMAPQRSHLQWRENVFLTMPACAEELWGVKLVSVVPHNSSCGAPVIQGLMVLNDLQTGAVLAVMDAASLTALRTGAVGAAGMKWMTPEDVTSVGIVGCGVQGAWQAIFGCAVRPVTEVFCFNRSLARIESFTATVNRHVPAVRVIPCETLDDLLAHTRVIIAATSSPDPVLPNVREKLQGKHFVSVGSFRPSMQELPDAVYALVSELIIDTSAAQYEVGDVINPLAKGLLTTENVLTLGQLIRGRRSIDVERTTVFKSVGMALYDVYVAKALYREAERLSIGQHIRL